MEMTAEIPNGDYSARRADRVCWFVIILGLLNVYDMYMTLRAMEYGIMFEANPIARFVIDHHGRVGVSLFKAFCVGTALSFFVAGRRLKFCELCCVTAVAVYCSVAVMWIMYPWKMFLNSLGG